MLNVFGKRVDYYDVTMVDLQNPFFFVDDDLADAFRYGFVVVSCLLIDFDDVALTVLETGLKFSCPIVRVGLARSLTVSFLRQFRIVSHLCGTLHEKTRRELRSGGLV